MSFRQDKVIRKSRKARKCEWCNEELPVGSYQVMTSGACGDTGWCSWGPYWRSYLHPECWRAEAAFWKYDPHSEGWMGVIWTRGEYDGAVKFSSGPLTEKELPTLKGKELAESVEAPGRAGE